VVVERVQQHITRLDELTRVVRRHPAVPDENLVPGVNVDRIELAGLLIIFVGTAMVLWYRR